MNAGNKGWAQPSRENTQWRAPGHDRMFNSHEWDEDAPGRTFTTKKKHGWWGKEEYYDARGRKIG